MEIRDAHDDDLPGILAIRNDVVATTTAIYSDEPATLEEMRTWRAQREAQDYPVLVALDEGGVAGFGSFGDFRANVGYRFTVEHSVHVRADARGRGIGPAIVEELAARARALGKHLMVGAVDAENEASLRMHERCGFVRTSTLHEVAWKFDRWLDLVFVERPLS